MLFFNKYPHDSAHELDLSWIITTVKEYVAQTDDLEEAMNDLQTYVQNFVDTVDIPEEVSSQIQDMITSGEMEQLILQTIEDNYGNDNYYARLHGKTIVVVGDSLTIGSGSALHHTYWDLIAEKYGATVLNYGISGSKISTGGDQASGNDMATRIDSIISNNPHVDIFVVEGGANDKNQNVPIGTVNSVGNASFMGAIKNIIVKLQRYYQKNTQILFRTTFHRYDTPNSIDLYEIDYVNAMKRACSIFSIPCYDNYSDAGISLADNEYASPQNTWADVGLVDSNTKSYHFSAGAYEYMLPKLTAFLCNAYASNPQKPQAVHAVGTLNNGFTYIGYKTIREDGMIEEVLTYSGTATFDAGAYGDLHYSTNMYFAIPSGFTIKQHEGVMCNVRASTGMVLFADTGEGVNVVSGRFLRLGSASSTTVTLEVHIVTPASTESVSV